MCDENKLGKMAKVVKCVLCDDSDLDKDRSYNSNNSKFDSKLSPSESKALCKVLQLPFFPFDYQFKKAMFCKDCKTYIQKSSMIFAQIESLNVRLTDIRSVMEGKLVKFAAVLHTHTPTPANFDDVKIRDMTVNDNSFRWEIRKQVFRSLQSKTSIEVNFDFDGERRSTQGMSFRVQKGRVTDCFSKTDKEINNSLSPQSMNSELSQHDNHLSPDDPESDLSSQQGCSMKVHLCEDGSHLSPQVVENQEPASNCETVNLQSIESNDIDNTEIGYDNIGSQRSPENSEHENIQILITESRDEEINRRLRLNSSSTILNNYEDPEKFAGQSTPIEEREDNKEGVCDNVDKHCQTEEVEEKLGNELSDIERTGNKSEPMQQTMTTKEQKDFVPILPNINQANSTKSTAGEDSNKSDNRLVVPKNDPNIVSPHENCRVSLRENRTVPSHGNHAVSRFPPAHENRVVPHPENQTGLHENGVGPSHEIRVVSPQENQMVSPHDNQIVSPQENEIVSPHDSQAISPQENQIMSTPDNQAISSHANQKLSQENHVVSPQENQMVSHENHLVSPQENYMVSSLENQVTPPQEIQMVSPHENQVSVGGKETFPKETENNKNTNVSSHEHQNVPSHENLTVSSDSQMMSPHAVQMISPHAVQVFSPHSVQIIAAHENSITSPYANQVHSLNQNEMVSPHENSVVSPHDNVSQPYEESSFGKEMNTIQCTLDFSALTESDSENGAVSLLIPDIDISRINDNQHVSTGEVTYSAHQVHVSIENNSLVFSTASVIAPRSSDATSSLSKMDMSMSVASVHDVSAIPAELDFSSFPGADDLSTTTVEVSTTGFPEIHFSQMDNHLLGNLQSHGMNLCSLPTSFMQSGSSSDLQLSTNDVSSSEIPHNIEKNNLDISKGMPELIPISPVESLSVSSEADLEPPRLLNERLLESPKFPERGVEEGPSGRKYFIPTYTNISPPSFLREGRPERYRVPGSQTISPAGSATSNLSASFDKEANGESPVIPRNEPSSVAVLRFPHAPNIFSLSKRLSSAPSRAASTPKIADKKDKSGGKVLPPPQTPSESVIQTEARPPVPDNSSVSLPSLQSNRNEKQGTVKESELDTAKKTPHTDTPRPRMLITKASLKSHPEPLINSTNQFRGFETTADSSLPFEFSFSEALPVISKESTNEVLSLPPLTTPTSDAVHGGSNKRSRFLKPGGKNKETGFPTPPALIPAPNLGPPPPTSTDTPKAPVPTDSDDEISIVAEFRPNHPLAMNPRKKLVHPHSYKSKPKPRIGPASVIAQLGKHKLACKRKAELMDEILSSPAPRRFLSQGGYSGSRRPPGLPGCVSPKRKSSSQGRYSENADEETIGSQEKSRAVRGRPSQKKNSKSATIKSSSPSAYQTDTDPSSDSDSSLCHSPPPVYQLTTTDRDSSISPPKKKSKFDLDNSGSHEKISNVARERSTSPEKKSKSDRRESSTSSEKKSKGGRESSTSSDKKSKSGRESRTSPDKKSKGGRESSANSDKKSKGDGESSASSEMRSKSDKEIRVSPEKKSLGDRERSASPDKKNSKGGRKSSASPEKNLKDGRKSSARPENNSKGSRERKASPEKKSKRGRPRKADTEKKSKVEQESRATPISKKKVDRKRTNEKPRTPTAATAWFNPFDREGRVSPDISPQETYQESTISSAKHHQATPEGESDISSIAHQATTEGGSAVDSVAPQTTTEGEAAVDSVAPQTTTEGEGATGSIAHQATAEGESDISSIEHQATTERGSEISSIEHQATTGGEITVDIGSSGQQPIPDGESNVVTVGQQATEIDRTIVYAAPNDIESIINSVAQATTNGESPIDPEAVVDDDNNLSLPKRKSKAVREISAAPVAKKSKSGRKKGATKKKSKASRKSSGSTKKTPLPKVRIAPVKRKINSDGKTIYQVVTVQEIIPISNLEDTRKLSVSVERIDLSSLMQPEGVLIDGLKVKINQASLQLSTATECEPASLEEGSTENVMPSPLDSESNLEMIEEPSTEGQC